ncbi:MAG: glycosyltransferase family 4 protein, partial [Verrucomicrobia bacterium]|nr:glycosyltransferase family 4 protein [Verrucomicrobiota bacterium]
MRTLFLNRFYWPDEPATAQLLTDLAESLAARGHEVVVIASHPGRPEVPATETRRGVRIVRVRGTRWARSGLVGKAVDYASFYVGALWRLLLTARHGDAVVALTDPPLLGVGVWLVTALRGARLFHWAQDIYPELAIELAGQRWLGLLRPLRDLAWRRAERCITLGADMAAIVAAAGVPAAKISLAPNWAPAGLAPQPAGAGDALRRDWGLVGKFVIAYSGNLGRVHDLDPVLAVAAELRADPRIVFLFVGGGARRAALETEAARLGLTNVQFRPAQPRAQLASALALGDVHLVTLLPGRERYVFPSKLYGIAAVGRPVVFIGPRGCELGRLVATPPHHFGRSFDRSEIGAI